MIEEKDLDIEDDLNEYKEHLSGLKEFAKLGGGKDNNTLLLFMDFNGDCSSKVIQDKETAKPEKQIKKDIPKDINLSKDTSLLNLGTLPVGGKEHKAPEEESFSEYYDVDG